MRKKKGEHTDTDRGLRPWRVVNKFALELGRTLTERKPWPRLGQARVSNELKRQGGDKP